MQFVKKRIVVEAVQFTGENWAEVHEFTGHFTHNGKRTDVFRGSGAPTDVFTAEVWDVLHQTWVLVRPGQWVIRGTAGEYYPSESNEEGTAPMNYEEVR